ncbi:MAG: exodeoxyribonuclease VII large subunit [Thermotogae bacterium]|nr:exodeoxyribonuclease VII large subunit [Thermotogota bacterium]HPB86511.1 exodeoxyribonuclease VII large subunit [Thermotogota bacterium]HQQ65443.1 exodeoxyribonuclease VII large subunit [Thermotogota bacterium]
MDVYSVGQCLAILQSALAQDEILQGSLTVRGEISGWKIVRGHAYFSLKDAGGMIKSVYFSVPAILAAKIAEGNVVDATGQFKIYAERGELQLYVRAMRLQNVAGLLQLRFEELKMRLNREGVIPKPPEARRSLPSFPRQIGVVASRSSAAFADIVQTLQKRYPVAEIRLFHTGVQGENAKIEIVRALQEAGRSAVEVVILARGGGSIEDLWPFNEEVVVRAVRNCEKPIIVGVGHEIDHTLSEYAADVIASTPTGAAMQASPDLHAWMDQYRQKVDHARLTLLLTIRRIEEKVENFARLLRFYRPDQMLLRELENAERMRRRLAQYGRNICQGVARSQEDHFKRILSVTPLRHIEETTARLDALYRIVKGFDPGLVLHRGYAWIEKDGKIMSSVVEFGENDPFTVRLKDGNVEAVAKKTIPSGAK